jgi:hypothetical protein
MKLRILGIEHKANLSNIDKTAVLAAGVIAGVIPIILLLDYSYILLLVLAMYIYGCAKDIKKIWQLDKIIKSNYLGDK